jgi:hypothetical protein
MKTTKKRMNPYMESISRITGVVNDTDLAEIEDYMRNIIFHSTLDWLSPAKFRRGALIAWEDIQFSRNYPFSIMKETENHQKLLRFLRR